VTVPHTRPDFMLQYLTIETLYYPGALKNFLLYN
jgi:hypothetical protein